MIEKLDRAANALAQLGLEGEDLLTWSDIVSNGLTNPDTYGQEGYAMLAAYAEDCEESWVAVWWMLRKCLMDNGIRMNVSDVLRLAMAAARGEEHED